MFRTESVLFSHIFIVLSWQYLIMFWSPLLSYLRPVQSYAGSLWPQILYIAMTASRLVCLFNCLDFTNVLVWMIDNSFILVI